MQSPTTKLKGAVTRTRNKVDSIAQEYGANDIPPTSPLHPKMQEAKVAHREAVKRLNEHQFNVGGT